MAYVWMNSVQFGYRCTYLRRTFPSFAHQIKIPQKDTFSICEQETKLKSITAFCFLITGLLLLLLLLLLLFSLCLFDLIPFQLNLNMTWKKTSDLINLLLVYFSKLKKKQLYTSNFRNIININKFHLYTCCGIYNKLWSVLVYLHTYTDTHAYISFHNCFIYLMKTNWNIKIERFTWNIIYSFSLLNYYPV